MHEDITIDALILEAVKFSENLFSYLSTPGTDTYEKQQLSRSMNAMLALLEKIRLRRH